MRYLVLLSVSIMSSSVSMAANYHCTVENNEQKIVVDETIKFEEGSHTQRLIYSVSDSNGKVLDNYLFTEYFMSGIKKIGILYSPIGKPDFTAVTEGNDVSLLGVDVKIRCRLKAN